MKGNRDMELDEAIVREIAEALAGNTTTGRRHELRVYLAGLLGDLPDMSGECAVCGWPQSTWGTHPGAGHRHHLADDREAEWVEASSHPSYWSSRED